ncbi:hypothetical protein ACFP81_11260 [Deinococcus lacus]|uniref:Uncharacterized protein n=1 Tax=Deinococcus lacus TaxID=392561 RepID=A0ABW1YE13_9DEIO
MDERTLKAQTAEEPQTETAGQQTVFSAPAGSVTVVTTESAEDLGPERVLQAAQPQAERTLQAADQEISMDELGSVLKGSGEYVEYAPVEYTDPGQVTEQFDHLATRDPAHMEGNIRGGGVPATHLQGEEGPPLTPAVQAAVASDFVGQTANLAAAAEQHTHAEQQAPGTAGEVRGDTLTDR